LHCSLQSFPPALGALVKLKTLKASGNKLSWLPPEMAAIKGLQVHSTHKLLIQFFPATQPSQTMGCITSHQAIMALVLLHL
jgi:Leucine-rich repeat (LRR) protein